MGWMDESYIPKPAIKAMLVAYIAGMGFVAYNYIKENCYDKRVAPSQIETQLSLPQTSK
jgi:hypothetical protein